VLCEMLAQIRIVVENQGSFFAFYNPAFQL